MKPSPVEENRQHHLDLLCKPGHRTVFLKQTAIRNYSMNIPMNFPMLVRYTVYTIQTLWCFECRPTVRCWTSKQENRQI